VIPPFDRADHDYMARAIALARRGRYSTDPNPRVGCVLVRDGEVVGEGWHRRAGEPHAERLALAAAGERARGATAYVTLEPCCHHGRTPPCTEGLLEAGVSRVVAAMTDPNPLVAGKGLAQLRDAGVEISSGLLETDARALNPGFIKRMQGEGPYVRLKLAMSLDGRTAMANGESQWITGAAARRDVQWLRAGSSAVVTGIGTLVADDPSLNVRLTATDLRLDDGLSVRQPLRVVMDSQGRMPTDARMLRLPGATLVYTGEGADTQTLRDAGALVQPLACDAHGRLSWRSVMQDLARREINEVLLECGATLAGSALQAGVVDELIVYLAPHLMGSAARGLVELPGVEHLGQRIALRASEIRTLGEDLRLCYRPLKPPVEPEPE
jgi:diaminohydroxyphosphoribosylaminopyrimidine deaminase/5-amino-6-(5-phosphoribosylamino)uracil reductase